MGVLPPFPRVDHEVAETGAGRRQSIRLPRFDRGGLDDGHQNPFGRLVAENNMRVLVVGHCMSVRIAALAANDSKTEIKKFSVDLLIKKKKK